MPLLIGHFPLEILRNILHRISAHGIVTLQQTCGDRSFSAQVKRSNITSLGLYDNCLRSVGLKYAQEFPGLTHLYIQVNTYEKDLDLHLLPNTLVWLHIFHSCRTWLHPCAHTPKCPVSTSEPRVGCGSVFNFKHHLPNLTDLDLRCTNHVAHAHDEAYISILAMRCLPDGLKTLSMSHLTTIHPIFLMKLPEDLEIADLCDWTTCSYLHVLAHNAPNVRLRAASIVGTYQELPATHFPAPLRLTIYLRSTEEANNKEMLLNLHEAFPPQPIPAPPMIPTRRLPPSLISIEGYGWSEHAVALLEQGAEKIRWPASLKTLEDNLINPPIWQNMAHLPQTITRLCIGIAQAGPIQLPSTLTSLMVCYGKDNSNPVHLFEALPPLLLDLTITLITTQWDDALLRLLPCRVDRLTLLWPNPRRLTSSFLKNLPTYNFLLVTDAVVSDTIVPDLAGIPLALVTSNLEFTGTLIPKDATYFHYGSKGTYSINNSEIRLVVTKIWESSTLRFCPTTLPQSLTHFKISSINQETSQFERMALPNLHTIELAAVDNIDWTAWSLPSLTHLILTDDDASSTEAVAGFPTSVTRLSLKLDQKRVPHLPPFLSAQLVHFETDSYVEVVRIKFPKLTSFEATDTPMNLRFFPALTDIKLSRYCSAMESFKWLISTCVHLKRISTLPNGTWCPKYDEIAEYANQLEIVELNHISLSKLPKIDMDLGKELIQCDTPNIEAFLALQAQRNLSVLKMPPGAKADVGKLPSTDLATLSELWSLQPAKNLDLSSWDLEYDKIGELLPPTLESLFLPQGLSSGPNQQLPRSITSLRIHSSLLTDQSVRGLPPGLISLHLVLPNFLTPYGALLPSTLEDLTINATVYSPSPLAALPTSLKSLKIENSIPYQYFYRGLPPNLTRLNCVYMDAPFDMSKITSHPNLKVEYSNPPLAQVPSELLLTGEPLWRAIQAMEL